MNGQRFTPKKSLWIEATEIIKLVESITIKKDKNKDMDKKITNPCFRCGKERIISRTWTETIQTFSGALQEIECSDANCPDPECQNLLNQEFAKQKEKRDKIAFEREERMKAKQSHKVPPLI